MKIIFLSFLLSLLMISGPVFASDFVAEYKPAKGVFLSFPEHYSELNIRGYSHFQYNLNFEDVTAKDGFKNRFSRIDIIFKYLDKHRLFIEFDVAGSSRTDLIFAEIDYKYHPDHEISFGKFITPFSPEDHRSTSGLSTVERHTARNSLFKMPALFTQIGVMFRGSFGDWDYKASYTNGNATTSTNPGEDNNFKDVQLYVKHNCNENFHVGVGGNWNPGENSQPLYLLDHTFNTFNKVDVEGARNAYLVDFQYQDDK